MKPINTQQIIKFNALLRQLNWGKEKKEDLIYSYTNGRSEHTNDMLFNEARDLISYLAKEAGEKPSEHSKYEERRQAADRMRKKVIAICYSMGWVNPATAKFDKERLNNFIKKYPVNNKKPQELNDYDYADLPKVVSQFEQLQKDHLSKFKNQ